MGEYRTFTGTPSEYTVLHSWVRRQKGTPSVCEDCGDTGANRYEWANVSGKYKKDVSDWRRLCKMCHYKFDGAQFSRRGEASWSWNGDRCKKGHPYTEENTYMKRTRNGLNRMCRECQRGYFRKYNDKQTLKKKYLTKPKEDK